MPFNIRCILVSSPAFNKCLQQQTTTAAAVTSSSEERDLNSKFAGYMMSLASVMIAGFVTVYFEKVVKSKTEIITIWERNFQLCVYSLLFCVVMHAHTGATHVAKAEEQPAPLSGWTWLTTVVALLGAANGLVVAATLKHADSILKVLAQAGAIVISTWLGNLFQDEVVDIFVVVGCLVSVLSIMNYTFDATVEAAAEEKDAGGMKCEEKELEGLLARRERTDQV